MQSPILAKDKVTKPTDEHVSSTRPDESDLKRPTVQKLLAAAAAELLDPEYALLSGLHVSRIAQRAGVSEPHARRYFKVQELRDEVVRYLLDPSKGDAATRDNNRAHIEDAINDRTAPLGDTLVDVTRWTVTVNSEDPRTRIQMALMAYAGSNEVIPQSLSARYETSFKEIRNITNEFLASHSNVVALRSNWIRPIDLGYVAVILCEGFAMHAYLSGLTSDQTPTFDPEVPGRAFKAIFASMFDDTPCSAIDEFFERVDAARRAGTAGATRSIPDPRPWENEASARVQG